MKRKWLLPALAVGAVLLFMWTVRENFEDTPTIQGPPYGNTSTSAGKIIDIMSPAMLTSIKKRMGITSLTLTDIDKVRIVYGDGSNTSPIGQVMSNFYWKIYKPATVTIDLAALNKFLGEQTDAWVIANIPDVRDFLTRYFLQGQTGYGDRMNTVLGSGVKAKTSAAPAKTATAPVTEAPVADSTTRTLLLVAIVIAGFSVLATIIVFFLPARV